MGSRMLYWLSKKIFAMHRLFLANLPIAKRPTGKRLSVKPRYKARTRKLGVRQLNIGSDVCAVKAIYLTSNQWRSIVFQRNRKHNASNQLRTTSVLSRAKHIYVM